MPLGGPRWRGGLSRACTQTAAQAGQHCGSRLEAPLLAVGATGQGGRDSWSVRALGQQAAGGFGPSSAPAPPLWTAPPVTWAAGPSLPSSSFDTSLSWPLNLFGPFGDTQCLVPPPRSTARARPPPPWPVPLYQPPASPPRQPLSTQQPESGF